MRFESSRNQEKTLDKYHPNLASSYRNLARAHQIMDRPVEAIPYIEKAAKIVFCLNEEEQEKMKDIPTLNVSVSAQLNKRPFSILSFEITDYHDIRHIELPGIPYDTAWIFLTGENSSGKNLTLQALVIGLSEDTEGRRVLIGENLKVEMANWQSRKDPRYGAAKGIHLQMLKVVRIVVE